MEYPEMGIRPSESGYTELQALGREIRNMKGEPHLHVPDREMSKPQSSRSLGDRVVALMHEAIGQRHSKHDDAAEVAEYPTVPLTPSVVRESIVTTDVFVTPRSRFSNDAMDGEAKTGTEAESNKVKDQKTQLTVPESIKDAPPSNSSTSIKDVGPHTQLSTPEKGST
jgi:superfamily II DNA or RNA helicase